MDFERPPRSAWPGEGPSRPAWVIPAAILIVAIGAAVAILIATSADGGPTKTVLVEAPAPQPARATAEPGPSPQPQRRAQTPPHSPAGPLGPGASASFESLAASIPARIGFAVAQLGGGEIVEYGELRGGHAWSTIKVPILVTLMRERGSAGLGAEEEGWAASALTASDNDAAAALFGEIEAARGGLAAASAAVGETLAAAGDTLTTVATAPPPSGAVSTYGQTEWSLAASAQFFRALAQGCLLDSSQTSYVEGLMGEVLPEQRWGLGEAGFPAGWTVGLKGGWGPEGGASGPYLVRQAGILRKGRSGIAVAMAAEDEAGSYEAGAADLTRIAEWLAGRLSDPGAPIASCG